MLVALFFFLRFKFSRYLVLFSCLATMYTNSFYQHFLKVTFVMNFVFLPLTQFPQFQKLQIETDRIDIRFGLGRKNLIFRSQFNFNAIMMFSNSLSFVLSKYWVKNVTGIVRKLNFSFHIPPKNCFANQRFEPMTL